jgi:putative PEP-CTERM system histidine kinase
MPAFRHLPRPLQRFAPAWRDRPIDDRNDVWFRFTRQLSASNTPGQISSVVVEHVLQVCRPSSIAVYLAEPGQAAYHLSASAGPPRFCATFSDGTSIAAWFHRQASPVNLPDHSLAAVATSGLTSALVVPIRWRARVLGAMVLEPQPLETGVTAEGLEFVATIAEQAAASLMALRQSEVSSASWLAPSTMVHDIKNAVSTLSLLAQNVGSTFYDPQFQRDAVHALVRTVERMRRVLVRLSSPEAEQPLPTLERINLRELILDVTSPLVGGSRIRLVRRLEAAGSVSGDREALLRVIENLVTNAIDAISTEGTVTVTLVEQGPHAAISVADTGCGMPEEYQKRHLFAPFRSTKVHGWGVGLYQVRRAVDAHGGEIVVDSVEDRGTIVTVKLPLLMTAESPVPETVR